MKIIKCKTYEDMSKEAAKIVIQQVKDNPKTILGLSTGSTPVGLYKEMIEDHNKNHTSYSQVTTINPDEYVGLPKEHDQSYYYFMHTTLFDHIDVTEKNIHIPSGLGDVEENCKKYNEILKNYSVDIQILGIGSNGHIGFNEPGTSFSSVTHVTDLTTSTIKDNMRFFDNDINKVPKQAVTMGISNILSSKKIILLASGANKAKAIEAMIKKEKSEVCPASALQGHPDVTVIVDEGAGSLI